MFVLVDESLPRRLAGALADHETRTVGQMGWLGRTNGDLLRSADAAGFSAFITADRSLEYQQNIPRFSLGVIVLLLPKTAPELILPLAPQIMQALERIEPGRVIHIGTDTRRRRA